MRLNAELIFELMPENLHASIAGPREPGFNIARPRLYEGGNEPFISGNVYLCYADRLPSRPRIESGCVIVAIGQNEKTAWCANRCCTITLPENSDFFQVFNALQDIYDKFDSWEQALNSSALMGNIEAMLDCTLDVINNPIYCIDQNFQVLAVALPSTHDSASDTAAPINGNALDLGSMNQYLDNHELSMAAREPLMINLLDQTTLNFNLYDDDVYEGCLTIHYTDSPYRASDKQIIEFLGTKILQAMKHFSLASDDARSAISKVVRDLVEERPLDATRRALLLDAESTGTTFCIRAKSYDDAKRLPLGYIRSILENAFPHSISFEHNRNSVVAFLFTKDEDELPDLLASLDSIASSLGLKIGTSTSFKDLIECRLRYLQADRALDIGLTLQPNNNTYYFADFALYEMISRITSEMPLELLAPSGLIKLAKHDEDSSASYIETLRCYLNNNANTTQTAKELYIHRSTLMERLARIKRELNVDLDDPDMQLQLRILLKAMQIKKEF